MAVATVQLPLLKACYVDKDNYSTHHQDDGNTWYNVVGKSDRINNKTYSDKRLYLGFDRMPAELRHKYVYCVQFKLQGKSDAGNYHIIEACRCAEDFDKDTLTYESAPVYDAWGSFGVISSTTAADYLFPTENDPTSISASDREKYAKYINPEYCKSVVVAYDNDSGQPIYIKTKLKNSSTPYILVTYNSEIDVDWKVNTPARSSSGTFYSGLNQTFTWSIEKADVTAFCAEGWEISSGKLQWRYSGESNWNDISGTVSADALSCSATVPAYTFQSGSTVELRSSAVSDSTTKYSDVITITTQASQITQQNSPTSGYRNPRNAITFSWYFAAGTERYAQQSATFYYKKSTDGSYTSQTISGSTPQSITIPANTFESGKTYKWYLSGTDASGVTSTTSVYSFSTAAGAAFATAVSPISTLEDKDSPITFIWTLGSTDGQAPSAVDLVWKLPSESDTDWHYLLTQATATTSYTAAADTFTAGEIQWKVVPYNIDGDAGTDSAVCSFICFGAPEAPVVYATEVPFSTIGWQETGQQAYEIMVDDKTYGPYFGTSDSFAIPEYLADGNHIIKVRIQGAYSLWSDWGETAAVIANEPGEEISLASVTDIDAILTWITAETTSDFFVYRDGVLIGHTTQATFTDRFALGAHKYTVVNKLSDGNYSISNEEECVISVEETYIASLDGGEWIPIEYTLKNDPEYAESLTASFIQLAGRPYPVVAASEYMDKQLSYSAVFLYTQAEHERKFAALFGRPAVIKLKNGDVNVCFISSWKRAGKLNYYTSYSFTVRMIDWEDFVDDTA